MHRPWLWLYRCLTACLIAFLQLLDRIVPSQRRRLLAVPDERLDPKPVDFQIKAWFHAVSLGEAQVLWAVLKQIPADQRQHFLLTTSTEAGMGLLAKHFAATQVRYLPLDTPRLYRKLLRKQKPPLVLTETELWPNLFAYLGKHTPIIVINARLSATSLRAFKPWQRILTSMAQRLTRVLARSAADADNFQQLGTPAANISTLGNIKYDIRVPELQNANLRAWFESGPKPLLFASISTDEAPLLAPQIAQIARDFPQQRILWVPRHLNESDLAQHQQSLQTLKPQRFSQWSPDQTAPQVLILDVFGQLGACYAKASIALVGGSFNQRGGQNFLEPMQAGTPVMVGPHTANFQSETIDALAADALLQLQAADQVANFITQWLQHPEQAAKTASNATQFLEQHRGAIAQTIHALIDLSILENLEEHP